MNCGLFRSLCRRGSGGRGNSVVGRHYFLMLPCLESACLARSGTRIAGINKSGSGQAI